MPSLYNAYEAKLINVLHSKLCKENKKEMISLSWATYLSFEENWFIFKGDQPTHSRLPWSIFMSDLPTHTQSGLFLEATSPHTHAYTSLFSWATCPYILKVVYFHGRPAHTHSH
jgi:hypothetical protein